MNSAPKIKLEIFEGPLDLLLHLIKKNEVDIRDIPVAVITKQYMEYLELMRFLNLEIAGEFLVMASTLLYLKSRMLLPEEREDDEEEIEDPRKELVERLLEYKKFKDLAELLEKRKLVNRDVFVRETAYNAIKDEMHVEVSLFDLLDAFRRIMERSKFSEIYEFVSEKINIKEVMLSIVQKLENGKKQFDELFDSSYTKEHIIATFIAILELAKISLIRIYQFELFGPIYITLLVSAEICRKIISEIGDEIGEGYPEINN